MVVLDLESISAPPLPKKLCVDQNGIPLFSHLMKKVQTLECRTMSAGHGTKLDSLRQKLQEQMDEDLATYRAEVLADEKTESSY